MAFVLKKPTPSPTLDSQQRILGFNLDDFAESASAKIDECQKQIDTMIAKAKLDAQQIREEAKHQGYLDGKRQAEVDIDREISSRAEQRARTGLDMLRDSIEQMHLSYESWMNEYAESLSDFTLAAIREIVGTELRNDPELLVRWANEALQHVRKANKLIIAVHPETLAQLGAALDEMLAAPELPEQTEIVPDATVEPTEIVIRQPGGSIRAGLVSQLNSLEQCLR